MKAMCSACEQPMRAPPDTPLPTRRYYCAVKRIWAIVYVKPTKPRRHFAIKANRTARTAHEKPDKTLPVKLTDEAKQARRKARHDKAVQKYMS